MMRDRSRFPLASLTVVAFTIGMASSPTNALAQKGGNPNPGVLPPNSHAFGHSYGEWSAKWWQWAYSMPIDKHPLFDTADCSEGQQGNKVMFLGGTFTSNPGPNGSVIGEADRTCTVPAGTALFFPVINNESSTIEGNGTTEAALRASSKGFQDHAINQEVTIDGVPIKNLDSYRVQSPLFTFGPLPDNNLIQYFGITAPKGTTSPSVADGVFLMLAPLPKGQHTIHYSGAIQYTVAADGFDFLFELDVTYHITVKPGR